MLRYRRLMQVLFPYAEFDRQIAKFRVLAKQYEAHNRAYYGEYLSRILFD